MILEADFEFDNKTVKLFKKPLSHKNTGQLKNIYTLITGINGIGKSRFLEAILEYYIQDYNFHIAEDMREKFSLSQDAAEIIYSDVHGHNSRNVIAFTNTKMDRFPEPKDSISHRYSCFGAQKNRSLHETTFLRIAVDKTANKRAINDTLKYLGYSSKIQIYYTSTRISFTNSEIALEITKLFKKHPTIKKFFEAPHEEDSIHLVKEKEDKLQILLHVDKLNPGLLTSVKKIKKILELGLKSKNFINNNNLLLSIDYSDKKKPIFSDDMEIEDIYSLVNWNLMAPCMVKLFKPDNEKQAINLYDLSSGEQALLNLFIYIAGKIGSNSIICIDEPEVSLHPKWQTEFIVKLQELFDHYSGCHFIIATHSPQIVSGLNSKNGYVVDLGNNETYSSEEYTHKSSDFQLAKIFNSPGYSNEYLIRIGLILLSKLTKRVPLTEQEEVNLIFLKEAKNNLPIEDVLIPLIEQIESLERFQD